MSKQPSKRYRAALQVADLKAKYDVNPENAARMIAGTARSMGIEVVG